MKHYIFKAALAVAGLFFIQVQYSLCQVKGPAQTFIEKEVVYWDFHSRAIGDDFTIYVHVPPGYDTSSVKYPVLYLTDGDWDKNTASNSFSMLRQDFIIREAVIVCIGYGERHNQRNRDFEPNGGGPNFLAFIEKELIPFVESKYRVTDDRTLSGYSYGGRFATYVLFNQPGLFNTICIGAPGTGPDLVPSAERYFANHTDLKARVFLGVGSYEPETARYIEQFKTYLLNKNCKDLEVETRLVLQASHGAAKSKVIQDGIEFAFCQKHKPIRVPPNELEKYSGNYGTPGNPNPQFKFYVEKGKLFYTDGGLPVEFTPYKKDGFFKYENERAEIAFKEEGGKMYELYIPYGQAPLRFEKIN